MSFYHPDRSLPRRFGLIQTSFLQTEGLMVHHDDGKILLDPGH